MISRLQEVEIDARFREARGRELPYGELGWVKVSRSKLSAYRRFVNVFFDSQVSSALDFHSIVVDTSRIDDRTYNDGSRSAGFNKEIYQLLMKFGRNYGAPNFHVYLDQRSSPTPLSDLRDIVNWGMMRLTPKRDWPVRRLHYRNSAQCHSLQAVDLLLGSLAFQVNGHRRRADASPAKCELSDYILDLAKVRDPFRDTTVSGKFTIWHRQLKPPKKR